MGVASYPTKLPLATFAKIAGIHPLHFEGISFTPGDQSPTVCNASYLQYDWQEADRISREQIAKSIQDAEELIERYLNIRLAPSWEVDEWKQTTRPYQPELISYRPATIRRYPASVRAEWGWFISGGIEAKTLVEAASLLVYSDSDSDMVDDTATTTAAVTVGQEPCEIEAYYPGHAGDAAWQIRPIRVTVVGALATIVIKKQLLVKEDLFESLNPVAATWETNTDFLETVDIYRHYNDPSQQATLVWEPIALCGSCLNGSCGSCTYSQQSACLHLRSNPKNSEVAYVAANWDADALRFDPVTCIPRNPDIVRLFYRAGLQSGRGCSTDMPIEWAMAVSYLAMSLMDRPICDCAANTWENWREDLGVSKGGEQEKTYFQAAGGGEKGLNNPFGTRRGAMYAWKRVQDPTVARIRSAVLIG